MECLRLLIGLSDDTCSCFDTDRPVDYNTSNSGQFITDQIPIEFTNSAADCERGGVWDILEKSRNQAIRDFVRDFSISISNEKDNTFEPFAGLIGRERFNGTINPVSTSLIFGHRIKPAYIKGGCITLNSIQLALDGIVGSTDVDVEVYSSLNLTTPISATTVTLTASNQFFTASFPSSVILDLSNVDEELEWYIVYSLPAGTTPVNNKLVNDCGCGGPDRKIRDNPFLQFGEFKGIESTTVSNLENVLRSSDNANGLRLDGFVSCDTLGWLCDLSVNPQDVSQNKSSGQYLKLGMAMSDLILFRSAAVAADKIVSSKNINRITMLSKEGLWGKMKQMNKMYQEGMIWFARNVPDTVTDCFTCKEDKNLSVNTIAI